jgi:threonine aldolase
MLIDLRSDTVTRPTAGMREAMMNAPVGDDVFGDDPTINALQEKAAAIFGMDAALYCPSGTMTNQVAIKTHTQPGDEVIIEATNHAYFYEAGGIAFHSGCSVRLIKGDRGRILPADILDNINGPGDHSAVTKLVSIENTTNRGGGAFYTMDEMKTLSEAAHSAGIKIHLDGARIFNALIELNADPASLGKIFDSISFCLSKGLGCPVGSLIVSDKEFIRRAKKYRKIFGGGMRQAGVIAAAGIYALDHHINRLKEDHRRAKLIGEVIATRPWVEWLMPVETNIIIFKLKQDFSAEKLVAKLKEHHILCLAIGKNQVRMLTHLDVNDEMIERTIDQLKAGF